MWVETRKIAAIGIAEYLPPEQFKAYEAAACKKGFSFVASGPFVRSSCRAAEMLGPS